MYAFKIQVQNPEFQIETGSQWALDFVYEAGTPFGSLPVATFDHEETLLHLASALHVQPLLQTVEQQFMPFRPWDTVAELSLNVQLCWGHTVAQGFWDGLSGVIDFVAVEPMGLALWGCWDLACQGASSN